MVAKIELRDYRVERADDVLSFDVQEKAFFNKP